MSWTFEIPFRAGRSNSESSYGDWGGIVDETSRPIVGCNEYDVFWGDSREYNLRLIAKAPDMLEVLKLYEKVYCRTQRHPAALEESAVMNAVAALLFHIGTPTHAPTMKTHPEKQEAD